MNIKNTFLVMALFCQNVQASEQNRNIQSLVLANRSNSTNNAQDTVASSSSSSSGQQRAISAQDVVSNNPDLTGEIASYLKYSDNDDNFIEDQRRLVAAVASNDLLAVKNILAMERFCNRPHYGEISPQTNFLAHYQDANKNNLLHIACAARSDQDIAGKVSAHIHASGDVWQLNKKNMKKIIANYRKHNEAIIQEILDSYKDNKDTIRLFYDRQHQKTINLNQNTSATTIQNMLNCEVAMRKHCLSINSKNKFELTPVVEAYKNNNIAAAHCLRSHGANMNSSETEWIGIKYPAPLHYAIQNGNQKEVLKLIVSGTDLNASTFYEYVLNDTTIEDNQYGDEEEVLPLDLAIESNNYEMVKLLFEHGANIEAPENSTVWSRLERAIRHKNIPMIALLLAHGADVYDRNDCGQYHLDALFNGSIYNRDNEFNKKVFQLFIDNGFDLTRKLIKWKGEWKITDKTILHRAFKFHSPVMAHFLLQKNANLLHAKDDAGQTPLHMITTHDDSGHKPKKYNNIGQVWFDQNKIRNEKSLTSLIKIFQRYGGNIDVQDNLGNTALHLAIQYNNIHAASSLLNCGANSLVPNNAGVRARNAAATQQMKKLITSFIQP